MKHLYCTKNKADCRVCGCSWKDIGSAPESCPFLKVVEPEKEKLVPIDELMNRVFSLDSMMLPGETDQYVLRDEVGQILDELKEER